MKVEPRGTPAHNFETFVGMTLKRVRAAARELVVSFESEHTDFQTHLICTPEGNLVKPPDETKKPFMHITGMKYEIGTGELSILADVQELAGEAFEVIGKIVTNANHDARMGSFGLMLGDEIARVAYSLVITPMGVKVLCSKELTVEFRKPLVTQ